MSFYNRENKPFKELSKGDRSSLIEAYVKGEPIEYFSRVTEDWRGVKLPCWTLEDTYRVKPPEPTVVTHVRELYYNEQNGALTNGQFPLATHRISFQLTHVDGKLVDTQNTVNKL